MDIEQRIADLSWKRIHNSIEDYGYGKTPPLLTPAECEQIISFYDSPKMFRSRVDMARHKFGEGEYQYFAYPLPPIVEELRTYLYPPLAYIANHWINTGVVQERFPDDLASYLTRCQELGQTKPTPLILRYEEGGYNGLHQDIYGPLAFPLQAACVLSQNGVDYTGGEFLLFEERSKSQMRGTSITIDQGAFIIFPNSKRPVGGRTGNDIISVRHGISTVTFGERYTLGIIFHNAR